MKCRHTSFSISTAYHFMPNKGVYAKRETASVHTLNSALSLLQSHLCRVLPHAI